MNTSYRIAEIALDKYGRFWVTYYGTHAEQGGLTTTYASLAVGSMEDALDILKVHCKPDLAMAMIDLKERGD